MGLAHPGVDEGCTLVSVRLRLLLLLLATCVWQSTCCIRVLAAVCIRALANIVHYCSGVPTFGLRCDIRVCTRINDESGFFRSLPSIDSCAFVWLRETAGTVHLLAFACGFRHVPSARAARED